MEAATYDPATADHNFAPSPPTVRDVERIARLAASQTRRPQWIHHHAHGHLCNAKCGPLEGPQ